ncbi:MAG: helix-turn-helix domain-containing protein [Candidatus Pacearchaeota archaeon]
MDINKDKIKESFQKVKEDIRGLHSEINFLKNQFKDTREEMIKMLEILEKISKNTSEKHPTHPSTHNVEKPTTSTHPSTHPSSFKPLKYQNLPISTGNQGVSTDRQTDRQTDTKHSKTPEKQVPDRNIRDFNSQESSTRLFDKKTDSELESIDDAAHILESLDSVKKQIRRKFKRLTDQEFLVFSTLYQLEEEEGHADYRSLAKRIGLSESSIRDYIGRLVKKGVPIDKKRVNNKTIHLSISQNLKKITSLPTIFKLRDL